MKDINLDLSSLMPDLDDEIDTLTISITKKDGKIITADYRLSEDGRKWVHIEKPKADRISDRELAESYFNGFFQNGPTGFDEKLIKNMSLRYNIPVSVIKAAVTSFRFEMMGRKPAKKDIERE